MSDWMPIETAPKDGTVFLCRGFSPSAGRLFAYSEDESECFWAWDDSKGHSEWESRVAYPTHWKKINK